MTCDEREAATSAQYAQPCEAPGPVLDNAARLPAVRALLLVTLALGIGGAVPALLAFHDDVFTQDDIRQKLPPLARQKISDLEAERDNLNTEMARIETVLRSLPPGSAEYSQLTRSRQAIEEGLKKKTVPLQFYGYMGSQSPQFYYPLFLLMLGTLVFIVRPSVPSRRNHRWRTSAITIGSLGSRIGRRHESPRRRGPGERGDEDDEEREVAKPRHAPVVQRGGRRATGRRREGRPAAGDARGHACSMSAVPVAGQAVEEEQVYRFRRSDLSLDDLKSAIWEAVAFGTPVPGRCSSSVAVRVCLAMASVGGHGAEVPRGQ